MNGSDPSKAERDEVVRLSRELLLRMAVQNGTVAASALAAGAFLIATTALPARAGVLALGAIVVIGALVLQWCHSGVRIMQITAYMFEAFGDADLRWERWLRANRPRRLLGARWAISTKGVFLGCQLAVFAAALGVGRVGAAEAGLALLGMAGTAGFLLTNPKE